jgi:ferredoxin
MRSALILGSGPSAAAAAMALAAKPDCQITVIDIGLMLDPLNRAAQQQLSVLPPEAWPQATLRSVTGRPTRSATPGLPEKRAYGSDFAFRDIGQRAGVRSTDGTHEALISGAYGGFSTVWGAGILPFPKEAFLGWPVSVGEMAPHYRAVLSMIPYAAEQDDLAGELPLYAEFTSLPPLSTRAGRILDAYRRHRGALNDIGIVMGRSRLALRSTACIRCGLCMTGCPYSLIYSAADTLDELRHSGRISYQPDLLAVALKEENGRPSVTATNLRTFARHQFSADRVFVACGAIGTTRLILNSLRRYGEDVELHESAQFVVPFVSRHPTPDPRRESNYALGQFCAVLNLPQITAEPAHLQFYTYNSAFDDALPIWARPFTGSALRRVTVGVGYLPSSVSGRLRVRLKAGANAADLPEMSLSSDNGNRRDQVLIHKIGRVLLRCAPSLDLWPVLPRMALSAPGKSYHWGGSFPHRASDASGLTTDRIGRIPGWDRIHLVDSSVLPSIAATTPTLTAMANAHRIAAETLALDSD